MEIYIQIVDKEGRSAWWNHEGGIAYLMDGKNLEADNGEYLRGTAFKAKSIKSVKREKREALGIARFDGFVDPIAYCWRFKGGRLARV